MKIYLVGGAVRDQLLGQTITERDWVVVGATPEHLLRLGYRQVGRDFPVFLHPKTQEEYALARTERKIGKGYLQFTCHAAPEVTLEEDLQRRDLTINAIAQDPEDATLIDPYGGQRDLAAKLLRHVSPAFVEDPVRILRIARFAARFAHLGFRIADETLALMQQMVVAGEIDALVPERVWQECARALKEPSPHIFFSVLRQCGALAKLFPELEQLFGVPNPPQHHPEIDTGVHVLMVLEQAAQLSASPVVRFAALLHDLGKGTTPPDLWPKHYGHEERGAKLIIQLCQRYRVPQEYRDLAILTARWHTHCHRAFELTATTVLDMLEKLDVVRRPQRFERFLLACEADSRGRAQFEMQPYPQRAYLQALAQIIAAVPITDLLAQGFAGKKMGEHLRNLRLQAIKNYSMRNSTKKQ